MQGLWAARADLPHELWTSQPRPPRPTPPHPTRAAYLSSEAQALVKGLLQKDPARRLGYGPSGSADVMRHTFFRPLDWAKLEARQVWRAACLRLIVCFVPFVPFFSAVWGVGGWLVAGVDDWGKLEARQVGQGGCSGWPSVS